MRSVPLMDFRKGNFGIEMWLPSIVYFPRLVSAFGHGPKF